MNDPQPGSAVDHSATARPSQEGDTQFTVALNRIRREQQSCPIDAEAPVARFESAF